MKQEHNSPPYCLLDRPCFVSPMLCTTQEAEPDQDVRNDLPRSDRSSREEIRSTEKTLYHLRWLPSPLPRKAETTKRYRRSATPARDLRELFPLVSARGMRRAGSVAADASANLGTTSTNQAPDAVDLVNCVVHTDGSKVRNMCTVVTTLCNEI